MSSYLFKSCYNVMSSLMSIFCLDNRAVRSEASTKTHCIFCWRWNLILAKIFNFELAKVFFQKDKLLREPCKTNRFLSICVVDFNTYFQHVYSQYAPFSLDVIYRLHSWNFVLAEKKHWRWLRKLVSHISQLF